MAANNFFTFLGQLRIRPVWITWTGMLCLAAGLAGCTGLKADTRPDRDEKALKIMDRAKDLNSGITTSRGIGHLVLETGAKKEKYKMAWAAQAPDRLRLTLLLSGHPVETIAASGEWVSFVSHTGKHKPHSAVSTDPDLDSYIGIPVRLSEMIALLLGRIPIRPFDRARISPADETLVLASRDFTSGIQEVRTGQEGQVAYYRLLDKNLDLVYGVKFSDFQKTGDWTLPRTFTIIDPRGRTLDITLDTIIPNAPVKESIFRLTGSGS